MDGFKPASCESSACLFFSRFVASSFATVLWSFLTVHSVTFGGVHENVVAACGASPISRIQDTDFQKQFAEFGIVVFADLLGQKFLRRRGATPQSRWLRSTDESQRVANFSVARDTTRKPDRYSPSCRLSLLM
jgi:hypothetical protein